MKLERQVRNCLKGISKDKVGWICYEPRWAIGAGVTPTLDEIEHIHLYIKELLVKYYGKEVSDQVPVIYAGSCQSENVFHIYTKKGVDGVGFGGCSLDLDWFSDAIKNVVSAKQSS